MKLNYKKGKGDKIHLFVDGNYILTVDESFFYTLSINQNQEVDSCELNRISALIGERRAYNLAVSLLSRRDHTARELRTKLAQKGFEHQSESVVQKLISQGFVNDERFAEQYVRELLRLKNYGKKRIEQELFRKGIERDVIKNTLEQVEFSDDTIIRLIERKYLKYLNSEKGVQKTINSLYRLGYSFGEIKDAIKTVIENNEIYYEVTDE